MITFPVKQFFKAPEKLLVFPSFFTITRYIYFTLVEVYGLLKLLR